MKQLEFTKKNSENELIEAKNYYLEVTKTIKQNQVDFNSERKLYQSSVFKLDSDINLVNKLTKTIKKRQKKVQAEIEFQRKLAEAKRKAEEAERKRLAAKAAAKAKKAKSKKAKANEPKKSPLSAALKVKVKVAASKSIMGSNKTAMLKIKVQTSKQTIPKTTNKKNEKDKKKKAKDIKAKQKSLNRTALIEMKIKSVSKLINDGLNLQKLSHNLVETKSKTQSSDFPSFYYDLNSGLSLLQISDNKQTINLPYFAKIQTPILQNSALILTQITSLESSKV